MILTGDSFILAHGFSSENLISDETRIQIKSHESRPRSLDSSRSLAVYQSDVNSGDHIQKKETKKYSSALAEVCPVREDIKRKRKSLKKQVRHLKEVNKFNSNVVTYHVETALNMSKEALEVATTIENQVQEQTESKSYEYHLYHEVLKWLQSMPIAYSLNFTQEYLKDNVVKDLVEKIKKHTSEAPTEIDKLELMKEIDNCINSLPIRLPNNQKDSILFKNGLKEYIYTNIKLYNKFLIRDGKENDKTDEINSVDKRQENLRVCNITKTDDVENNRDRKDEIKTYPTNSTTIMNDIDSLYIKEINLWLDIMNYNDNISREVIVKLIIEKTKRFLNVPVYSINYKLKCCGAIIDVFNDFPIELINPRLKSVYLNRMAAKLAKRLMIIKVNSHLKELADLEQCDDKINKTKDYIVVNRQDIVKDEDELEARTEKLLEDQKNMVLEGEGILRLGKTLVYERLSYVSFKEPAISINEFAEKNVTSGNIDSNVLNSSKVVQDSSNEIDFNDAIIYKHIATLCRVEGEAQTSDYYDTDKNTLLESPDLISNTNKQQPERTTRELHASKEQKRSEEHSDERDHNYICYSDKSSKKLWDRKQSVIEETLTDSYNTYERTLPDSSSLDLRSNTHRLQQEKPRDWYYLETFGLTAQTPITSSSIPKDTYASTNQDNYEVFKRGNFLNSSELTPDRTDQREINGSRVDNKKQATGSYKTNERRIPESPARDLRSKTRRQEAESHEQWYSLEPVSQTAYIPLDGSSIPEQTYTSSTNQGKTKEYSTKLVQDNIYQKKYDATTYKRIATPHRVEGEAQFSGIHNTFEKILPKYLARTLNADQNEFNDETTYKQIASPHVEREVQTSDTYNRQQPNITRKLHDSKDQKRSSQESFDEENYLCYCDKPLKKLWSRMYCVIPVDHCKQCGKLEPNGCKIPRTDYTYCTCDFNLCDHLFCKKSW